jgi:hypothetical protein
MKREFLNRRNRKGEEKGGEVKELEERRKDGRMEVK